MENKGIIGLLILAIVLIFSFTKKANPKIETTTIVLKATQDFVQVTEDLFVPSYKDKNHNALAINAGKYKNKYGKAVYIYSESDSTFDLKFTSLTEIDGESSYRILIDNQLISQFQNPETAKDYIPYIHKVKKVCLKKGQKIQVEFSSHSNGKIPEGKAFAFARGRWVSLELTPSTKKL